MNTINFYLSSFATKDGFSQIIVKKGNESKRLPYSIPRKDWNTAKQSVNKTYEHWFEINSKLQNLKVYLEKKYIENPNKKLINLVNEFYNPIDPETDFTTVRKALLQAADIKKNVVVPKRFIMFNIFISELNELKMDTVNVEEFNVNHVNKYISYLVKKGQTNNTILGKLSRMKTLLNTYSKSIRKLDLSFFQDIEQPHGYESDLVALSDEELNKLINIELTDRLEYVRDAFVLACNTGARYIDVKGLKISNDIWEKIWRQRVEKTRDVIYIPLNQTSLRIIEKYRGTDKIPMLSNQKTNDNLKRICKEAGIEQEMRVRRYSGNKMTEEMVPKWDLISFHAARRTFITLALTKGVNPEIVMKISGHKTSQAFKKYIKFSDKQISDEFLKKWE